MIVAACGVVLCSAVEPLPELDEKNTAKPVCESARARECETHHGRLSRVREFRKFSHSRTCVRQKIGLSLTVSHPLALSRWVQEWSVSNESRTLVLPCVFQSIPEEVLRHSMVQLYEQSIIKSPPTAHLS